MRANFFCFLFLHLMSFFFCVHYHFIQLCVAFLLWLVANYSIFSFARAYNVCVYVSLMKQRHRSLRYARKMSQKTEPQSSANMWIVCFLDSKERRKGSLWLFCIEKRGLSCAVKLRLFRSALRRHLVSATQTTFPGKMFANVLAGKRCKTYYPHFSAFIQRESARNPSEQKANPTLCLRCH